MKYFVIDEVNCNGEETGRKYLSDCLHCSSIKMPKDAVADDLVRPNQLFAITLGLINDEKISKDILEICNSLLLIPGAIRSLADKNYSYPTPVYGNKGELLNNPNKPYWGIYGGVEDISRKPAYHNGTAWTWPFPSYCEAYYKVYGQTGLRHAKSVLSSAKILLEDGVLFHIPEILDGDYPHIQKGCGAQAWGITELYRVWKLLHK